MSIERPEVGDIVKSTKGRDEGTLYIVYMTSEDYAFCVNGKNRSMSNPKKKKFKHISSLKISDELAKKFKEHQKVLDSDIRKTIDNLNIV